MDMGDAQDPYGATLLKDLRMHASDDQRVALAPAAAKRRRAGLEAAPFELVSQSQHQARAARSDRVPEGHRAAVDVHPLLVDSQHACGVEGDGGEGHGKPEQNPAHDAILAARQPDGKPRNYGSGLDY